MKEKSGAEIFPQLVPFPPKVLAGFTINFKSPATDGATNLVPCKASPTEVGIEKLFMLTFAHAVTKESTAFCPVQIELVLRTNGTTSVALGLEHEVVFNVRPIAAASAVIFAGQVGVPLLQMV